MISFTWAALIDKDNGSTPEKENFPGFKPVLLDRGKLSIYIYKVYKSIKENVFVFKKNT